MKDSKKKGNMIEIKGLKKSFKTVEVLKGVDLEVRKGSIFALLGSNGAGKTTMIRIMATLLKPDAGRVMIHGFDLAKEPDAIRRAISLTGQFAAVDEILTGRENVEMIGKLRHLKDAKGLADRLLKQFSLIEAANRPVDTYSGGMKRRVDIAMSLVGNPEVIFLDEPTTGLDPEARLEVWGIVKDLSARGTTVFLTTQYLDEAEQLADEIAILHEGRIIAQDSLEGLKKRIQPEKIEYIEKQPTLEEVFLTIIGKKEEK